MKRMQALKKKEIDKDQSSRELSELPEYQLLIEMKVKQNKIINRKTPRFVVDGPVNQDIENIMSLVTCPVSSAFVGTSGSGKTSLMYSLLTKTKSKVWKNSQSSRSCHGLQGIR